MSAAETTQRDGQYLPVSKWKRIGLAGFLFFLVKGLLWLAAPAVFYLLV